jgi:hypothetical protein
MHISCALLAITFNALCLHGEGEDVVSSSLRGRRLAAFDPRTVARKPNYSLQQDSSGIRGEFEQQSASHFESQVEQAQSESASLMDQGNGRLQSQMSVNTLQHQGTQLSAQQQQGGSLAKHSQHMLSSSMQDNQKLETISRMDDQSQQVGNADSRLPSSSGLSRAGTMSETSSSLEQGSMPMNVEYGDDIGVNQREQQQQQKFGSQSLMQQNTQSASARKGRNLEFIHVTKSAGSAIEAAAAKHNIMWGACHYWKITYLGCENPDWEFPKKRLIERMPKGLIYQGEPWHAPPHWNYPNMMEGSDTFLVVRNPVST